ncbi:hypothetical protein TIFTF001_007985 [Ficus carica]|uniref:Carboxypeptidase n=1 Tax=Ficus carica TaxID=3494 RepID=A0AA88D2H2_FICCA|nr:hypothetical protein TIFTF001_007985 [Ficus carica]
MEPRILKLLLLLLNPHSRHSQVTASLPALPFPNKALPTKSGYLPVTTTSKTSSSIFYAFYEAENPILPLPNTPILIWLQGGPGCSSLYGNFLELGPWLLKQDPKHPKSFLLESNPTAWNRIFGVLFLDNPIGSGFSTASVSEIPTDHISVAKHLYIAITRFVDSDQHQTSSFRSRPVYIAGESYAGKYVPAIGHYILKKNARVSDERRRINLAGIAIGNGLTDPLTQVGTHASNAYFSGLVNDRQRKELERLQADVARLVAAGKWREATRARYKVIDSLYAMTGLATLYDFTRRGTYRMIGAVTEFLNDETVKRALGADETAAFRGCNEEVKAALEGDTMKSVKYAVEELVRKSRVLLYQGMFDLWDGVVSTEAWVRTVEWEGTARFLEAERKVWRDGKGELAGYVQRWGNLSNVVVYGAGHLVPVDQPVNSQAMIEDWVLGRGLFEDVKEEVDSEDLNLSLFD